MRFWRTMATLGVLGLFYVGHGLHQPTATPFPGESVARGGVIRAVPDYSPFTDGSLPEYVTCSQDGLTLYFWSYRLQPKVIRPACALEVKAIEKTEQP